MHGEEGGWSDPIRNEVRVCCEHQRSPLAALRCLSIGIKAAGHSLDIRQGINRGYQMLAAWTIEVRLWMSGYQERNAGGKI